jgi:molybdenum cofactor sulfurtransferase
MPGTQVGTSSAGTGSNHPTSDQGAYGSRSLWPMCFRSFPGEEGAFLADHPAYGETRAIDVLRAREFSRLDDQGHVYLDYAGSGLYAASQVRRHSELLLGHVFGNPHSSNPASVVSARLVESCRHRILEYFRAPEDEYTVVFTANASQALRLVGESYPFGPGDQFLLTFDNHNSVNGIREFARARGARTLYVPMIPPELRVDETVLDGFLEGAGTGRHNLFAYPAQSNFSGAQHPLEWVSRARSRGWDILLDAASFVPSNRLDISRVRPDFVALSFYKMFGYPTGVGALVARREALMRLRRPWFAGGTVDVVSVQADRFAVKAGPAAFEDGTVNFSDIPAVELGLNLVESVRIEILHERIRLLTDWLIKKLIALEHRNGRALVRLHGPAGIEGRGGTITFNLQDASGRIIDPHKVEEDAARRRISLRTGCFCNPGAGEVAFGLTHEDLERCFARGEGRMDYEDLHDCVAPRATGAVRISLGLVSNFADVWKFREYVLGMLSRSAA